MLKEAETSKGQERTNTDPETPKSLRANPSALPVEGSMARVLLQVEAEENMKRENIGDREPKSVDFGCFGLALCRLNARIFHP